MTEYLLQYLWKYKIFKTFDFKDIEGNPLEILDFGTWNKDAGADFQLAKIRYKNLIFSGHIEFHLKSSDWELHKHSENRAYQNVILHAVYQHDIDVNFLTERNIPTLELKNYIDDEVLQKYNTLSQQRKFIPCEELFSPKYLPFHFHQNNILKKLDEKSLEIERQLLHTKNDYEAVLFHSMAYGFGLKINAEIFQSIAQSVDYSIIRKLSRNRVQLEAFLLGVAGWLEHSIDEQTSLWKREFDFIKQKFSLTNVVFSPKFLRLRPPNFPTLRLSQLAYLYAEHQNLFSKIMSACSYKELKLIFKDIQTSEYWENHYQLGKVTEKSMTKKLSSSFIDLLIINVILPIKYTYHKNTEGYSADEVLDIYEQISPENNSIIEQWENLGCNIENALQSQSYLYHYKNFCLQKKCLNCDIGFQFLRM